MSALCVMQSRIVLRVQESVFEIVRVPSVGFGRQRNDKQL